MLADEMGGELNYRESSSEGSEDNSGEGRAPQHQQDPQLKNTYEQPRRLVGRPKGSKNQQSDPEIMLQEELLQMLKLTQSARRFAEDQLKRLAEAAVGADNIKTKIEIAKTAVGLTSDLTKTAGNIIEQLKKQPGTLGGGGGNESSFSFEDWLKTI